MPTPDWKPRNTTRAQSLRRQATPTEREVWRHLARSQLGAKFSRQMSVAPFFVDFLCRELKLMVELDDFSHDLAPDRDAGRDRWMAREGYTVLRFANAEVFRNLEGVITAIGEAIARQRVTGPLVTLLQGRLGARIYVVAKPRDVYVAGEPTA